MTLKKFLKKKRREKRVRKEKNQKRNNSIHLKLYKRIIMAKELWKKAQLEKMKELLEKENKNENG